MLPLNKYLDEMMPRVRQYLDDLATETTVPVPDAPREPLSDVDRTRYAALLIGHISRNLTAMEKELARDPRVVDEKGADRPGAEDNRKRFAALKQLLNEPQQPAK